MSWKTKKAWIETKYDTPVHIEWLGWEFGYRAEVNYEQLGMPRKYYDWSHGEGYFKSSALNHLERRLSMAINVFMASDKRMEEIEREEQNRTQNQD